MPSHPLVTVALAVGLTMVSASVGAQQPRSADAEMQRIQHEQAKALKGWPGGIVFGCVVTPVDLASEPVKQICAQATANASTLAAQAKVKFSAVPDQRAVAGAIMRERALGLTVQVAPSDFNAPLAVLVVRVFASRPYTDLVSAAAIKGQNPAQNPLAIPRAGDAVFWEEAVVGSGPPAQLGPGIAPAIETKLRQFFAALTAK